MLPDLKRSFHLKFLIFLFLFILVGCENIFNYKNEEIRSMDETILPTFQPTNNSNTLEPTLPPKLFDLKVEDIMIMFSVSLLAVIIWITSAIFFVNLYFKRR